MRFVDEIQHARFQSGEGRFGDGFLKLLGLEITSRQQGDQVFEFAALELRGERNAEHVGVFWVVDVVGLVSQPRHCLKKFRGSKGVVVLLDLAVEVRRDGEMAEVINGLAQGVAAYFSLLAILDMAKSA